jgi:Leucine-rich repeat (LRR) protein
MHFSEMVRFGCWLEMGGSSEQAPDAVNCCVNDGFSCLGSDIKSILWPRSELVGPLSIKFSEFTSLESLDLSENRINGSVPQFIGDMVTLKNLDLSENKLTGSLPNLSKLTNLTTFRVYQNDVEGPIEGLASLTSLKTCSIRSTSLCYNQQSRLPAVCDQQIPCATDLLNSQCKALLNGYEKMGGLASFRPKENCCFDGRIQCSEEGITEIQINTPLPGPIPPELYTLENLRSLNLQRARVNGTITSDIFKLSKLENLFLAGNLLTGTIPDLTPLKNLKNLDLANNRFFGPVSFDLPLQRCSLIYNALCKQENATLPPVCEVNQICPASGENNQCALLNSVFKELLLDESLHPHPVYCCSDSRIKCNEGKITSLEMNTVFEKGKLPESFTQLSSLRSLTIAGGLNVPLSMLARFPNLEELIMQNRKEGTLSDLLPLADTLKTLVWKFGEGTGPINALAAFSKLEVLDLSYNDFNGTLGRTFDNMRNLQVLRLTGNNFVGRLPSILSRLPLVELEITGNSFFGPFPSFRTNPGFANLRICQLAGNYICNDDIYAAPSNCFVSNVCPSVEVQSQCEVLYRSHMSLNSFIRNSNKDSCCSNLGATCENENIVGINWSQLSLRGTIPDELFSGLPEVKVFNASGNSLRGLIPSGIQKWSKLETLALNDNRFEGSIPEFLGKMATLMKLDLSKNPLVGTIPPGFGTLETCSFPSTVCTNSTLSPACSNVSPCEE